MLSHTRNTCWTRSNLCHFTGIKKSIQRCCLVLLWSTLLYSTLVGCGDGSSSGAGGGTAPQTPAITSISPTTLTADPSGPVQVVITGTGFISTSQVEVNGKAVATTYISATSLQAIVPATAIVPGAKLLFTVVNGSETSGTTGTASTVVVNNPIPAVTSLQPSAVLAGTGATSVAVTGTGFIPATTVILNGSSRTVTFTSATSISIALSAADVASAGTSNLVATNAAPGGGNSAAAVFTVDNPMPVINSVTPANVMEGAAGFTLDVKGSGFTTGSLVYWNTTALATTMVGSNELTAAVPANLVAANATVQVVVTTPAPGGGQSTASSFSILSPKPVLSSISPTTVTFNQAASITLLGSGFDANSVAQWNGAPQPTVFISSTQLTVSLSATALSSPGAGQLTVVNRAPGGGSSAAVALTVTNQPIPVVNSVDLSVDTSGLACPQVVVHANGSNFGNTQLSVNGQALQTSGNQTDLFANLPAGFCFCSG